MGSRAVVVVCRDEAVSVKRFDVIEPAIGVVYTRTGRPFFSDSNLEREVLQRVQQATMPSVCGMNSAPIGSALTVN